MRSFDSSGWACRASTSCLARAARSLARSTTASTGRTRRRCSASWPPTRRESSRCRWIFRSSARSGGRIVSRPRGRPRRAWTPRSPGTLAVSPRHSRTSWPRGCSASTAHLRQARERDAERVNRAAAALGLLPGETTLAVTVTAVMLLTSTGAAMGGAATDALFFAHFDVPQLPLMYVALGAVTLAFTLAVSALLARPDRARLYAAIPLALGLVLVLERVLVATGAPWVFPAIWLAMNVVATLQGIVTWGVASSLTDTRQAKRLFPLFNAGRIGGSILGGFGTTALAGVLHAENLIPIWAASLVAAFALIVALFRARRPVSDEFVTEAAGILKEIGKGFAGVRRSPLLALLSLASVLFPILYFALALPLTREIPATFP